jgi:predicted nucleic acid binding AN1-type Zn finger protein
MSMHGLLEKNHYNTDGEDPTTKIHSYKPRSGNPQYYLGNNSDNIKGQFGIERNIKSDHLCNILLVKIRDCHDNAVVIIGEEKLNTVRAVL